MSKAILAKLITGSVALLLSRSCEKGRGKREAANGDVIKVNHGVYDHYGIYVKPGRVIHYTEETGPADLNGMVRETSLDEFLNGAEGFSICRFPDRPRALEKMDTLPRQNLELWKAWQDMKRSRLADYHLYSGAETIARARGELGKKGYDLICNNCEHFAMWCKTGVRDSGQVDRIVDILLSMCCS